MAESKIPVHVGIIMDGNGRWAQKQGKQRLEGHLAGTQNLRRVIRAAGQAGIRYLSLYAFSTENWNRPSAEVQGLMTLLGNFIDTETENLHREGARLVHIGHLNGLSPALARKVQNAIELTAQNTGITVIIAFNYGGRDEIVCAVQKMMAEGMHPEEVSVESFSAHMFTAGIPDPDLIIRTSGEFRTSNFLPWQSVYSEWAFPSVFWPDFDEEALKQILDDYAHRDRRFGGVKAS